MGNLESIVKQNVKTVIPTYKYGTFNARGALSADGRFLVQGEDDNPEKEKRNALIIVKDLKMRIISGKLNTSE